MARWSNATLVALGGFDKNVVIDELLYGEDNYYDISFLTPIQRTVSTASGTTINFTGGDNSVFTVGDLVSFGSDSSLYEIATVNATSIVLTTTPRTTPASGDDIQIPIDLTSATFQFRLLEQSATINDDTRSGVDISNIVPIPGKEVINLDSNVVTTAPGLSLALGQLRILINAANLVDVPVIDTTSPPFYTGYIGVTLPQVDVSTPAQHKKQRICFIIRSDGLKTA